VLLLQTCDDIDTWMNDLEKQIESEDTGTDLASVNILMQKQQVIHYEVSQTNCGSTLLNALPF
jgi:spectrin beta